MRPRVTDIRPGHIVTLGPNGEGLAKVHWLKGYEATGGVIVVDLVVTTITSYEELEYYANRTYALSTVEVPHLQLAPEAAQALYGVPENEA